MHQTTSSERSRYPGQGVLVPNSAELGLWIFLATVTMLFAAFTSAYLVRSASSDWQPGPIPAVLWINTVVLILSSLTLEISRSAGRRSSSAAWRPWFLTTTVLGLLFLGGQIQAWKELMELGFYIPTSPHSSFFYVLTGGHALHLFSGLLLLVYVYWRTSTPGRVLDRPNQNDLLRLCATYWHFLALLWMFLFAMISLW